VADLFAGTGAYGLEAMSRGAASGIFVENSRRVVACLQKNLAAVAKSCGANPVAWRVLAQQVSAIPPGLGPFDIVFMDPPYPMIEDHIPAIFAEHIAGVVAPNGRVCCEMPGHLELELAGWKANRRLGKTGKDKPTAVFYERS
jgi:16S rRNA (guanine966-N2)-methyltransferase